MFCQDSTFDFFPVNATSRTTSVHPGTLTRSNLSHFLLQLRLLIFISIERIFMASIGSLTASPESV